MRDSYARLVLEAERSALESKITDVIQQQDDLNAKLIQLDAKRRELVRQRDDIARAVGMA